MYLPHVHKKRGALSAYSTTAVLRKPKRMNKQAKTPRSHISTHPQRHAKGHNMPLHAGKYVYTHFVGIYCLLTSILL